MRRWIAVIGLIAGLSAAGCQKKSTAEYKISPTDASRKSPVQLTPENIADGKRLYHASDCAICHGREGDGKGVLAKDISLAIHNWKDPAVQKRFSDGDLFYILTRGRGMMPGYQAEETTQQMWQLVCFIRSLGTPGTTSSGSNAPAQKPQLASSHAASGAAFYPPRIRPNFATHAIATHASQCKNENGLNIVPSRRKAIKPSGDRVFQG